MQEARAFQRIIKSYNRLKQIQDESLTEELAVLVLQVIYHVKREPDLILQVGKSLIKDFAQETVENVTQDFLMDLLKYTSKENLQAYASLMKEIFQNLPNEAVAFYTQEHIEKLKNPQALHAAFSHIWDSLTIENPTLNNLLALNSLWEMIKAKEPDEVVNLLKQIHQGFSFLERMIAMWIDTAGDLAGETSQAMLTLMKNLIRSFCEQDLHSLQYLFSQQVNEDDSSPVFLLLWNSIHLPGADQVLMPVFERLANLRNPQRILEKVNLVNEVLALNARQFEKPEVLETLQRKVQASRVRVSENTVLGNGKRSAADDHGDAPSAQRQNTATH